ncbi:ercc6l [Symbiodinium microadriaticum]|nr:ercc6l [Symbiodinium microadriaticum]
MFHDQSGASVVPKEHGGCSTMRIGVLGCCHGELDRVYETVRKLERQSIGIDLLICCGDFMSVRNEQDLDHVCMPQQHRERQDMKDFSKYYTGRVEAPVTTIFVGGRNEAANLLREHYFGGWVAPRIYYLGCAGVVRIGPLRIAGISGNFVASDYFRGRHECPPFTEEYKRSAVHAREYDAARLEKLQEPIDIVVSYDWPRGIWKFGNYEKMCEQPDLGENVKREMEGNTLGSPAAMELLKKLRPLFWFSSSLQVKFPALVPHGDGTFTRFLALDRCRTGREYMQVLDIDPRCPTAMQALPRPSWLKTPVLRRLPVPLCYDAEWLAVQKVNHESISFSWQPAKAKLVAATREDVDWVKKRLRDDVGAVPSYRGRRHPDLLPTKLRKSRGAGRQTFQNFSTEQLRELYDFRGLVFPGHLDKPSMIKKLEEYDALHGEEEEEKAVEGEGFPIPLNFEAEPPNPQQQRARLLAILELHDLWKDQESQRRQVLRSTHMEQVYDPFSDASVPELAVPPVASAGPSHTAGDDVKPAIPSDEPQEESTEREAPPAATDEGTAPVTAEDQAIYPDAADAAPEREQEAASVEEAPMSTDAGGAEAAEEEDDEQLRAALQQTQHRAEEATTAREREAPGTLEESEYGASAAALAAAVMELAENFQEGDDPGPLLLAVDQVEGVLEALTGGEEVTEADSEEAVDGFAALAKALAEAEREEAEAAEAAAVVVDVDAPALDLEVLKQQSHPRRAASAGIADSQLSEMPVPPTPATASNQVSASASTVPVRSSPAEARAASQTAGSSADRRQASSAPPLQVGSHVRLRGLEKRPELNGSCGRLARLSHGGWGMAALAASVTASASYRVGQAVQVLSKSSNAWVDATIQQILPDKGIWVRYGNSHKVIPPELQPSALRCKAAQEPTEYALGQRVQVFSKTSQQWVPGIVREIWPDGSVHVQYEQAQHLYKVLAPELQGSMLRACGQIAEPDTQEEGGDSRVAALVEEAERLKSTIAKQQEEISALQEQRQAQPAVAQNAHGLVQVQLQTRQDHKPQRSDQARPQQQPLQTPQQGPQQQQQQKQQQQQQQQWRKQSASKPFTAVQPNSFARVAENREEENWTCPVCTFENVEPLTECEMCGTKRSYPSSPQRKRLKKGPPDIVEVEAVLDHPSRQNASEVTAGPAEFLRCATAVIEPGIGARSASQVQGPEDEALIEVPVPDCLSAGPSGEPLRLTQTLHDRLCPYQREGVAASVACWINNEIDTRPVAPATVQAASQLVLSMGGFAFSVLLHWRHSGSVWSPLKLLFASATFWCAAENFDASFGGILFGDHPWDPERMQVPMVGSMPAQQPMSLQWHLYLSLLMADTCLAAPRAAWPRAGLGALFATLLDAAAEPAWLASRLYRYTACSESAGYCILEVDPKNYVSWFLLMTLCFRVFLFWDGLPVISIAPSPITVIPYVAWLSVLIWYTNLIRASGGGVAWMWHLHARKHGGILADEMGLGKTVQACGMIRALRAKQATHVLVVMPVTLLDQWAQELKKWCPGCPVFIYHGSPTHRARALRAVARARGGVLLTSYAIIKNEDEKLAMVDLSEDAESTGLSKSEWRPAKGAKRARGMAAAAWIKPWDLVICDEAHVMRTISTLLGKAVRRLKADCRILLTGTPVQNALQDLWALMDFAQPGLLGNHATFTKRFNDPIEKGSVRDASPSAVALKKHLCEQLWELVRPHLLRRTKDRVGMMDNSAGVEARGSTEALTKPLPPRTEFVVWLVPSKDQVRIYQKALETSEIIHEANSKSKLGVEVFRAIGLLKRLCNHPALALPTHENWQRALATAGEGLLVPAELTRMARPSKRTKGPAESDPHPVEPEEDDAAQDAQPGKAVERMLRNLKSNAEAMISQSAKLKCLAALLPTLESGGHRTLIFSQGIRMMDLVEICILRKQKMKYLRIDGHTEIAARNERVRLFQTQPQSYTCMLLTTRVGGFGLNLTSADRVIILDPAWNPAVDMQAVDRAHRIGQDREVKTYRLVMSGLIEDKMFRLQVFKMGLTKTALETKQQQRYFTAEEIHGLFEWTDPAHGETRALLRHQHGIEDCAAQCDAPDEWLKAGPAVGLSSFSFLYSTLQGEQDDELAGAAPEVRLMKAKLKIAEDAAGKAAAARLVKEGSLTTAQQQLEKAAAEIKSATSARSTASEQLKRAQAALGQSKRQEGLVEKEVEKAQQSLEASAKRLAEAEAKRDLHDAEVTSGTDEARQGATALEEAETKLSKTLAQVEAELEKGLALEGPVAKIKAAQKAAARLAEADEAARRAREAASEEWVTHANHITIGDIMCILYREQTGIDPSTEIVVASDEIPAVAPFPAPEPANVPWLFCVLEEETISYAALFEPWEVFQIGNEEEADSNGEAGPPGEQPAMITFLLSPGVKVRACFVALIGVVAEELASGSNDIPVIVPGNDNESEDELPAHFWAELFSEQEEDEDEKVLAKWHEKPGGWNPRSSRCLQPDKALEIESRCAEHQTDMTLAMQGLAPSGSPPLKTLQSARRAAEKEKQTAEKAVAKISVSGSRAVERLNQAVAEIKSALNAVTSGLHGQSGEATQAYAKVLDGIGKELAEDWRSSRAAAEAAARGAANQRRAQRARLSSNSKAREETSRHAIVQRQYAKVMQNLEACRARTAEDEEALQTAQAAVAEAEGRERQQKRLRDDCKAAICDAKQCLKSARLAEKEATAERTSLYKHYAKADEGLKDALKFAKSAEQASAAERQKAIAAIKALRAEEYDANQVVEAYESKKRARQDQQDVA